MGDLSSWKDRVKTEIVSVKQELLRMENRFEALQQSIFGRIREYDNQVEGVGTDVKAIEKLLQNILNPLADNVKELKRITEKLKR
jgi:predicted  nucleic acid-binding Zn-ribbon protein